MTRGAMRWAAAAGSLTLLAAALVAGLPAPAGAAVLAAGSVQCERLDWVTGRCVVEAASPETTGSPAHHGGSTTTAANPSAGGPSCFSDLSESTVACSSGVGAWSNTRDCYVMRSPTQPPTTALLWEGHTDGAVYTCTPDVTSVGASNGYMFWSAAPPDAPDPAQLAQQAITAMGLVAVRIGIVPDDSANSVGLVGLPAWMWVEEPSATTFGPTSTSASAGGVTVTATAHVERVTWAMGDDATVVCTGAGTPYADADGTAASPDCGHTYTRTSVGLPGNAYTVTATSHWVIEWAGGGASGQQSMDLTATTTIRVGETQAVITTA